MTGRVQGWPFHYGASARLVLLQLVWLINSGMMAR
jgi:hypothetical protein